MKKIIDKMYEEKEKKIITNEIIENKNKNDDEITNIKKTYIDNKIQEEEPEMDITVLTEAFLKMKKNGG